MLELRSIDRYSFTYRGDKRECRSVAAPYEMSRNHPEIIGQRVLIDGEEKRVVAVERHLPSFPIKAGEIIGLLLD